MKQRMFSELDPITRLESRFPSPSLVELRIQSRAIEDEIQRLAAGSILRHFSGEKSFRAAGADEFLFNDKLYTVRAAAALGTPALQICVSGQVPPQAPQLARSVIVSTQRPPQRVVAPTQVTVTSAASIAAASIEPSGLPAGPTMLALAQAVTSATIIQENCLITRRPRRSP